MNQKQEVKQYGSIRKIKSYGTCGVILGLAALALVTGQRGYADEVVAETAPTTTITTSNPATNLPEAQAEPSPEQTHTANQAGTQSGELTTPVTSTELNGAVTTAKETGVAVSSESTPTIHESLESAQTDLANQKQAVDEATKKQEANNDEVKAAVEKNAEIDAQNVAEKKRVEEVNRQGQEAVEQRNQLGQAAVDARNAQAQAEVNQRNESGQQAVDEANKKAEEAANKENARLKAEYEAELKKVKDVEAHNAEVRKRNEAAEAAALEKNKKLQAEYEKKLAAYNSLPTLSKDSDLLLKGNYNESEKGMGFYKDVSVLYVGKDESVKGLAAQGFKIGSTTITDPKGVTVTNYSDGTPDGTRITSKVKGVYVVSDVDKGDSFKLNNIGKTADGININAIVTISTVEKDNDNPSYFTFGYAPDGVEYNVLAIDYKNFARIGLKLSYVDDSGNPLKIAQGFVIGDIDDYQSGDIKFKDNSVHSVAPNSSRLEKTDYGWTLKEGTLTDSLNDAPVGTFLAYGISSEVEYIHSTSLREANGWRPGTNSEQDTFIEFLLFGTPSQVDVVTPPIKEVVVPEKEEEIPATPITPTYVTPEVKTFTPEKFVPETFTPEVYKPITPTTIPHVEVPESKTYTVAIHPVIVKQAPKNTKSVVNEDNVNVNGQLVPKGHLATWVLSNDNLKAGRKEISEYKLTDPFPAGFETNLADLAKANQAHWLVSEDEKGQTIVLANQQLLNQMNANRNLDFVVPVFYASGRPLNDGGTYENTFDTTITTKDNEVFRTTSNTPVIYTPGAENRTYNGSVIVRYQDTEGNTIRGNVIDVEDAKVGSNYDTTDNKPSVIAFEGKQYRLTPKVIGEETGQVVKGTKYVTYIYELVPNQENQGSVIVHYVDEEGRPISNDVVDTPESPVGTDYNTTDNKPKTIKTNDGVEYHLVPEKTKGSEEGKVVEGTTEVTYVYKRITPKPETPTPDDHIIQPKKDVVDEAGNSINGTTILPNQRINYKLT